MLADLWHCEAGSNELRVVIGRDEAGDDRFVVGPLRSSDGSFREKLSVANDGLSVVVNPDNDWVSKIRDYPLIGVPVYAIFDPRTGTGAVLTDIHTTPDGPRYATRKDFVYGEDVTIGDWTISTQSLPRYGSGEPAGSPDPS